MNEIRIVAQILKENQSLVRMTTTVTIDGKCYDLFIEMHSKYKYYMNPDIVDHIVFLLLPLCMRTGAKITSSIPISSTLYHNISELLLPNLANSDPRYKQFIMDLPVVNSEYVPGHEIGTAITGGVDSTFTILNYTKRRHDHISLTNLLISSDSVDLWNEVNGDLHSWESKYHVLLSRLQAMANEINLPLVKIYSNFSYFLCRQNPYKLNHFNVNSYTVLANILAIKRLYKIYLISAGKPYNAFSLTNHLTNNSDTYELLTCLALSSPGFSLMSGGSGQYRYDKFKYCIDHDIAQKYLHPCFDHQDRNCSLPSCVKCLSALTALDLNNKLEQMKNVYDIELYKKNRIDYLAKLILLKDHHYCVQIYHGMMKKEPHAMQLVLQEYKK